jgi:hypothetical protein
VGQPPQNKYVGPDVQTCIDRIGHRRLWVYSSLDLSLAFHQVALDKALLDSTSFTIPLRGIFRFLTMAMGLKGSSSTFQKLMDLVTRHQPAVIAYQDNCLVNSRDFGTHLRDLEHAFGTLKQFHLYLNPAKMCLCAEKTGVLTFYTDGKGSRAWG